MFLKLFYLLFLHGKNTTEKWHHISSLKWAMVGVLYHENWQKLETKGSTPLKNLLLNIY